MNQTICSYFSSVAPRLACSLCIQQNRELQSDDVRVRQQALLRLNDVIHRRENLAAALREGSYIHNGNL